MSVSMYGWMDLVFVIYLTGYETVSGFALFCVMKVNCVPQSSVQYVTYYLLILV